MNAIEKASYLLHERLRAVGEAPKFMGEAGDPLPPQLQASHKRIRRQVGRHTIEEDVER